MKGLRKIVFIFLFVLVFNPLGVKADKIPVSVDGYSKDSVVGSEIVFEIKGFSSFDGTITYNNDELEYVSITDANPAYIEGAYVHGTFEILNNTSGKLEFSYKEANDNFDVVSILITFRVKSVSDTGKVTVTYTPNNSDVLYGQKSISKDFNVKKIPSEDNTTVGKKCNKVEQSKTMLYISWTLSGVLLITLVAVCFKKNQKNNH